MMHEVELLRAACCVAGLDGQVCEREHPLLTRLADGAGVGTASLDAMIERAQSDQNFYAEQFSIVKTEPEETMKMLFRVAIADGVLDRAERVILRLFADKLGMSQERFDAILAAAERHVSE